MSEGGLASATLDTFPINVAVIDADGEIVLTNRAWQEFAGERRERDDVGADYFAAADADDEDADAAVRGLRAVLAGERDRFELEYPCHSPEERRWFLMRVSPVDVEGERGAVVAHADITDRKEAELAAEERADQLSHLLDRVGGLLREVTTSVVAARSRPAVESRLCEALVRTDPYCFAWVGRPDLRAESLVPRAWAGEGPGEVEARGLSLSTDAAAARAYRTGDLQVVTGLDGGREDGPPDDGADGAEAGEEQTVDGDADNGEADDGGPDDRVAADGATAVDDGDATWGPVPDARAVAAVPLVYRETTYGVLSVYADEPDAFAAHERTVLRALGDVAATAVHAVTSGRVLERSSVVEVEFELADADSYLAALAGADGAVEHNDALVDDDGAVRTYVTLAGTDPGAAVERARERADVASARVLAEREDDALLAVVVEGALVAALADFDGVTRTLTATGDAVSATVTFPDETAARAAFEHLEGRHGQVDLVGYRDRERPTDTAAGFRAGLEDVLTERQMTALRMAYYSGYFEWPRDVSGEEVAASMDITRATFHQHLREAERKLAAALLDADG